MAGPGGRPQEVWPACESPSGVTWLLWLLKGRFFSGTPDPGLWGFKEEQGVQVWARLWRASVWLGLWKTGLCPWSETEGERLSGLNLYLGDVCLHRQLPLGMSTYELFMQKELVSGL